MRTSRRYLSFAVISALLVVIAACGDGDDDVSSGGGGGREPGTFDGDYLATEVTEDGQPRVLVDGTTIRLRLDGRNLTASAGCNTIGGDARIDGDVLHVGAVSMTEMGCDPPRHEQDEWLAEVLSAEPALAATDDGFVLRTDRVAITFVDREVADPDRALAGTTWRVDGYIDGTGPDGTSSSAEGDRAMVVFGTNGFVAGHDGCNEFGYGGEAGAEPTEGLRYEVDGDRITFTGSAITTDMACPDVDTDRFWAVLSGTVTWTVDGPRLTLMGEDRGVTFRAD